MTQHDEMVAAIKGGGSVFFKGRIINQIADLPSKASLVKGTPAEAATADDLDAQIALLQAQRATLAGARTAPADGIAKTGEPLTPHPESAPAPSAPAPEDAATGDAEAKAAAEAFESALTAEVGTAPAKALIEAGFDSFEQLFVATDEELLATPGVGQASIDKVRDLEARGLESRG